MKISKFLKIQVCMLVLFFTGFFLHSQTIHAVLIIDNNDTVLSEAHNQDLQTMQELIQFMAKESAYKTNITVIEKKNATKSNVIKTVANIKVLNNDPFILYYSGTAYRTKTQEKKGPNLLFVDSQSMTSSDFFNLASSKTLGLRLVMVDAQNTLVSEEDLNRLSSRSVQTNLSLKYKALLAQKNKEIFLCSSSEGQEALAFSEGSACTVIFSETMKALDSHNIQTWEDFLRKVIDTTYSATSETQRPFANIYDKNIVTESISKPTQTNENETNENAINNLTSTENASVSEIVYTNKDTNNNLFKFSGGIIFEYKKHEWVLQFNSEKNLVFLNYSILEDNSLILKSKNGLLLKLPLGEGKKSALMKKSKEEWKEAFLGEWKKELVFLK